MKVFCLGSLITVLDYASLPAVKMNRMVTEMFAAYGIVVGDDTDIGHAKAGSNNLSVFEDINGTTFEDVNNNVADFIAKHIQASHRPIIVRAIKAILKEDTEILDTDIIGYQGQSEYSKQEILTRTSFNFADLLTNAIYYAVARNNNNKKQTAVKEITKEFYNACFDGEEIHIIDEYRGSTTVLSSTINDDHFKNVFVEVGTNAGLNINRPNTIKAFRLDVSNNKFSYTDIKNFIKDNLSHYIFSRAKVSAYDSPERMAIDAFLELNKKSAEQNRFSEIMLYSFLEHSLNAPKLMSKIEIEGKSGNSTGIHFLASSNGTQTGHQLVFGSSETLNDIYSAIDSVFKQITLIDENSEKEVELVDNIIFEKPFDEQTFEYLKATIIPSKTNNQSRPENSYSAFVGYTINVLGPFKNNNEYRQAVDNQMKEDITNALPYIQDKITSLNLQNHSFYFYFLPLNNAEKDKVEIMKF